MAKLPKIRKCVQCGGERFKAASREMKYSVAGTKFRVDVSMAKCVKCGEGYLDGPDLRDAELRVAFALVEAGAISGDSFRFMRKTLMLKGGDLARLLGVTLETISRWENGKHEVLRAGWIVLAGLVLEAHGGATVTRKRLEALGSRTKLPKTVHLELDAR